jgi:hypothetical protein
MYAAHEFRFYGLVYLLASIAGLAFPCKSVAQKAPVEPSINKAVASSDSGGVHAFDFEFGAWKTHIRRLLQPLSGTANWAEYDGIHTIRPIWNGRGNVGELQADGPSGHIEAMSPRLYDTRTHKWHVTYGSSRDAGISTARIGEFKDGRGEFHGKETVDGKPVLVKETYSPLAANKRRFEIAYSADSGKTWETNWIMTDTRIVDDQEMKK